MYVTYIYYMCMHIKLYIISNCVQVYVYMYVYIRVCIYIYIYVH